jgi:tetratricopeptide (TPR) repeat protein
VKLLSLLGLLLCFGLARAEYHPALYVPSVAETSLRDALASAESDSVKKTIARHALEEHPDDVIIGRIAQDVLSQLMPEPAEWFKTRAERLKSNAADYLYARSAADGAISLQVAEKILARNPDDYWGLWLKAVSYGSLQEDTLRIVTNLMERAASVFPSRPDTYLYLGYYYKQMKEDEKAIAAWEAGAICDPKHKTIRDFRLTHYATHKQTEDYFALVPAALPIAPLEFDVTLARDGSKLTKEVFLGHYSILECWYFT